MGALRLKFQGALRKRRGSTKARQSVLAAWNGVAFASSNGAPLEPWMANGKCYYHLF